MRNDYFDSRERKRESDEESGEQMWERSPQPYGEVPERRLSSQERSDCDTPALQSGVQTERRKRRESPQTQTGRRDGSAGFFFLFAMLLISVCVTIYFQGGVSFEPFQNLWEEWGGWDRYDYGVYEEIDWTEELENTSIDRAPLGEGPALTLTPSDGTVLSAQEIYLRVSPCVVGVRSFTGNGMYWGTGIIMSSDGYIITNAHVIAGARRADVVFSDDSTAQAQLVGYDGGTDLAVLKIQRTDLPAATFGDSTLLQVGEAAYAIGNPLGEELWGTMTDGIISAIDRLVDMDGQEMTLIQTNAALNSGNSGGALINAAGQVVGVTNMKMMSEWETVEGLGFAVPSSLTKEVVDQIIIRGHYPGKPMLGVTIYAAPSEPDIPAGLYVRAVEPGSDAYEKGLRPGHIITAANGKSVLTVVQLEQAKAGLGIGDIVTLTVWTGEGYRSFEVELMDRYVFQ